MDGVDDCPFCRIIAGAAPARIVWSGPAALAFLPLNPAARGHTLVVPRRHVLDLFSLDDATASALTLAVLHLARAVRAAVAPDGMNIINSAGAAASQTVPHLHVHVVPRWSGDHFGRFWPVVEPLSETVEEAMARSIRRAAAMPDHEPPGHGISVHGHDADHDEAHDQ
jgi:histidine triad (HIT) family protein